MDQIQFYCRLNLFGSNLLLFTNFYTINVFRSAYLLIYRKCGNYSGIMPTCSIVQCRCRYTKNRDQLTIHRFPRGESAKKKWIEAIGIQNLNPRHKSWYICSNHFEDKCFNRTMDVVRLHIDSIPTIFGKPSKKKKTCEPSAEPQNNNISDANPLKPTAETTVKLQEKVPDKRDPEKVRQLMELECATQIQATRIKNLAAKYTSQRKKIRRLNGKVLRRDKKIKDLKIILEHIKRVNKLDNSIREKSKTESTVLNEECEESKDSITFIAEAPSETTDGEATNQQWSLVWGSNS